MGIKDPRLTARSLLGKEWGQLLLDVSEERILSFLCVWGGRTRDVMMGALELRKEAFDLALHALEGKRFVSAICAIDGDRYYVTEQGRR